MQGVKELAAISCRVTTRDYPYESIMTVGAILYGCPQSVMVALRKILNLMALVKELQQELCHLLFNHVKAASF